MARQQDWLNPRATPSRRVRYHDWAPIRGFHQELEASASGLSSDPGIARASEFEHLVEGGYRDGDLGYLGFVGAQSKGVADYVFVSAEPRLDPSPTIIAAEFLPAHPAVLGDGPEMSISLCKEAISAAALGTVIAYGGTMTAASGWREAIAL